MWRELLQQGKDVIQQFCRRLRGADRRVFQAEVATEDCGGSPRRAESMFGWCRQAVQEGLIEQEYQVDLLPHFARRGRRTCEAQSPTLARVSTSSRMASSLTTASTIRWNVVGTAWNDIGMGRC
ncbi:MAG: hypothetical protein U1A77_07880 [Pirellulales bacterium]